MKRRSFLQTGAAAASVTIATSTRADATGESKVASTTTFSANETEVRFHTNTVLQPVNMMVIADTHLFRDDERGTVWQDYSARMARAYNTTTHFRTGKPTNPEKSFEAAIAHARKHKPNLVALVGDILSFPSEAAVDWVMSQLRDLPCPWVYVAGNHDWHYEGLEGSLDDLRREWCARRLKPLYQGSDPLMSAVNLPGVRVLALDNSQYEILPEQLQFFRDQIADGMPVILTVHIPLYAPGRPVGFGCGHPDWCAATDRNFRIERRPKWRESGHTQTTFDFHREVFEAPNLLGVFAGHIHRHSIDVINGKPQVVTNANAVGAWTEVSVVPHIG